MNIFPIYMTPIAIFSHPEFIEGTRQWFKLHEPKLKTVEGQEDKFKSSLGLYGHKTEILVPNNKVYFKFEETVLANTKEFLTTCGYSAEKHKFKINKIWMNEMTSGSHHDKHNHYGSVLSGCFYIDVPKDSDRIRFTTPLSKIKAHIAVNNYTQYNSETWTLNPQPGSMLLWESYLFHEVPRTEFEGTRRSVAFDVVIE